MNQVILIGRLTSDPELKFINTGVAIAKFNIAIDRTYKKEGVSVTDFIPIEIWGKKAEYCATYIGKGYLVVVNGSLHMDRSIDSSGQSRVFAKVRANSVNKLSVPGSNSVNDTNFVDEANHGSTTPSSNFTDVTSTSGETDEDLPF